MSYSRWQEFLYGIGFRLIRAGYQLRKIEGLYDLTKPIDPANLQILGDKGFQASVKEVQNITMLDSGRLANLWSLCRMTDPGGNILEVGSYKGGGALHLSNSCPKRKIIICDSFAGFEKLDPELDKNFSSDMFKDSLKEKVASLFSSRRRNHEVIDGFFPASCANKSIGPISFLHLDVDVYKATIESLTFVEEHKLMMNKSLIVLDDYYREADGVVKGVEEFTTKHPRWKVFPIFPGQGLMVSANWFE